MKINKDKEDIYEEEAEYHYINSNKLNSKLTLYKKEETFDQ